MISKISFYNYRNLENNSVDFTSQKVQIVGKNGSGKSNLLSIIYFLCYGTPSIISTSFLSTKKQENIANFNFNEASISGLYHGDDYDENIRIKCINGQKEITLNGVKVQDRAKLFENKSCIHFSTFDAMLLKNPSFTRKVFDQSMSLSSKIYIENLKKYQRVLKNRNLTLKKNDRELIEIYSSELASLNVEIKKYRLDFMEQFNILLDNIAKNFTSKKLSVKYEPNIRENDFDSVFSMYQKNIDIDIKNGITMRGNHRDKYVFLQDGSEYFSQGELKLFSILLKLAQKDIIHNISQKKSILIFDDALLDLDGDRLLKVFEYFNNTDSVFFSFSSENKLINDSQVVYLENGKVINNI